MYVCVYVIVNLNYLNYWSLLYNIGVNIVQHGNSVWFTKLEVEWQNGKITILYNLNHWQNNTVGLEW